nr:dTMP kinase [Spiroplasma citri]
MMLFITLEGIDGSGKTTISKLLKEKLRSEGYQVVLTREPGGNEIAEQIRNVILSKHNLGMDPWTEALLYIAARRQHVVEDILPALKRGEIVICDRFMDSTSAYQGYARGLGIWTLDEVQSIVLGTTKPDLTLFFWYWTNNGEWKNESSKWGWNEPSWFRKKFVSQKSIRRISSFN